MIYWFTGQPGAGKTILGSELKKHLSNSYHVDGDDLREIFDNKDYTENGRRRNVELAQQISHFLHNKGCNVVVSLVSPYKDQRELFKTKLGDNIKEFYVNTTEIRGRENFHVDGYQKPTDNYFDVNTTNTTIEKSFIKIKEYAELG
jgi:adenylylsulfate kinase-like enzyme